ncbi:MAG: hypothetical protein ABIO55_00050 [Ginsengibacter sp.]
MKQILRSGVIILLFFYIATFFEACVSSKSGVSLTPPDKRPVSSVLVEDATEAEILQQELKLEIVKIEGSRLYYYDENNSITNQLRQTGYQEITSEDQQQVYKKYVMLRLPKSTDTTYRELFVALSKELVHVINREKDHWIIYGTLASLKNLKKSGYILHEPTYELRPREVDIHVGAAEDVQKISALGVDIFSTEYIKTSNGIIIHGGAFDYQIDSARAMNFTVTIKKQRL